MADIMSKAERSKLMAKIRGDSLKPETRMAAALKSRGLRFERNDRTLPGSPDFVVWQGLARQVKMCVFVHGCFWHCCPKHFRPPKSRAKAWAAKFERNRERDKSVRRALRRLGYMTTVVWEHSLKTKSAAQAAAQAVKLRLTNELTRRIFKAR